jgi:KaiC/GvpD/RAD55 family RecA-like ATPase
VSAILRVPPELIEFSLREPPRSLLIRGEPGAGKSTLALTLLSSFRGKRILLTSRVTREEVAKDFPWLASEVEGPIEVIEAVRGEARLDRKGRALASSDALVDSANADEDLEQLWLPDALLEAFSRIKPGTPGMVVIDSWDALIEHYVGAPHAPGESYPDREEIERLMLGLLGRGGVHLVLVVEREAPSQLDYLVDGVVACVLTSSENRLERWSHLKKMRGVRVAHPWYPYTLEGGRFLCIAPMPSDFRTRLQLPEPEADPRPDWLWPGSSDYASHFGRLQHGRMTLLEVDHDVPVESVRLVISPIQSQVLTKGGRILVILPPSLSPFDVWDAFRSVVAPEHFATNVRIYSPGGLFSDGGDAAVMEKVLVSGPTSDGSPMATRMPEANRFLREGAGTGVPNLACVWLNGLKATVSDGPAPYTPDTLPALVQKTLFGTATHIVMIGAPGDPFMVNLQEIASTRIAMKSRSGRVFLYGTRPVTPPLVLTQSDNGAAYHLVRIV